MDKPSDGLVPTVASPGANLGRARLAVLPVAPQLPDGAVEVEVALLSLGHHGGEIPARRRAEVLRRLRRAAINPATPSLHCSWGTPEPD